jgi:hypothetical protein
MFVSSLFLIAVIVVLLVAVSAILQQKKKSTSDAELIFEERGELFSPAERSFLGVLEQALSEEFRVFGKVRLGDVIQPAKGLNKSQRQTAWNKVNFKHLDYLICRTDTLGVVAAVELDDKSHNAKNRFERDQFIDQALSSAGIRMVRFKAQKSYEFVDVKRKLADLMMEGSEEVFSLGSSSNPEVESDFTSINQNPDTEEIETKEADPVPTCPKCQSDMIKRQAKKGQHAGKWFWACTTFPKCKAVISIE